MRVECTEERLILYIYNELSEAENKAVAQAIASDTLIRDRYRAIMETVLILGSNEVEPSPSTIEVIMEHAHYEELPH